MTKKDYELIANTLYVCKPKEYSSPEQYDKWESIVIEFAMNLKDENDNFDLTKFKVACYG